MKRVELVTIFWVFCFAICFVACTLHAEMPGEILFSELKIHARGQK